jgi:two-component system, NarL family, response regulator NreC
MDVPHLRLAPALADADGLAADRRDESIRVVLADDHAHMRRSLRLVLDAEDDLEVVAEANDLASVVRHVDDQRPRVLVLDLGMVGESGMEAVRRLRERAPETQIVVVTMEENPRFAQRALADGAVGFVVKELADEQLPDAIRLAAHGERYVSPRVAARLSLGADVRVSRHRSARSR